MDNISYLAQFLFVKRVNEYKVFEKKSNFNPCVHGDDASVFFSIENWIRQVIAYR